MENPWAINIPNQVPSTEQEAIKVALDFAVLAPSTHNSQPWEFHASGNIVKISLTGPGLPYGDPDGIFAAVSFGACIENFLQALKALGYAATEAYGEKEATFIVSKSASGQVNAKALQNIKNRYSEKRSFKSQPVSKATLTQLSDISDKVVITSDRKLTAEISALYQKAAQSYGTNRGFAKEINSWMKLSNKSGKGMPGASSGLSTPKLAAGKALLSLTPKVLVLMSKKYKDLIDTSNAIGCVCASSGQFSDLVKAGRLMQEVLLKATELGLSCTPLAAIVAHTESKDKLKKILKLEKEPVIFLRFGDYRKDHVHSPRIVSSRKFRQEA